MREDRENILDMVMIDESPFAFWSGDSRLNNMIFLRGLRPDYYEYLVETLYKDIDGESSFHAATAIRNAYFQCMENFFSRVFSFIQSPECQLPYILKYREEIDSLVEKVNQGTPIQVRFNTSMISHGSWAGIAEMVFSDVNDEALKRRLIDHYGRAWSRLSLDYSNKLYKAEYNSIKHGMRVYQGGFELSIGFQSKIGEACPPDEMISLGGSKFGNQFFRLHKLNKINYSVERVTVNWHPDNLYWAVKLLVASMKNIIRAAKRIGGAEDEQSVYFPVDLEAFELPWSMHMGALSSCDGYLKVEQSSFISPQTVENTYANLYPFNQNS